MICEGKGNLRYRARTATALATIALVAGGYIVAAGTPALAADSFQPFRLAPQGDGQSNTEAASGTAARSAPAEGASSSVTTKSGVASSGASQGQTQYEDRYGSNLTAGPTGQGGNADPSYGPFEPFRPDPEYDKPYDTQGNIDIYGGKTNVPTSRPILELGRAQYTSGDYGESSNLLGELNPLLPGLAVYGDWRTAVAYNQNNGEDIAQVATRLNIDVDFKITGTERLHAFFTPIQDNARFTRFEFGGGAGDEEFTFEFDPNPQTLFFEGDLGSLYSGFSGEQAGFDLPFTVGLFPLFMQNGIWANDAILGGAFTLPAQNSTALGLANFDITFFAAFDNVDNQSVKSNISANRNNNIANLYGVTTFIDAFDGYIEAGYGLIDGRDEAEDIQTHFATVAYSRRYRNTLSNTTRVFANYGDSEETDGLAIISENSLISGLPSTLLPYANFFVGVGAPQPLASADGILKNVGINFETDALTGFPKLNDTGSNAFGGAIGLQYLFNLDQQIVIEAATVQPYGDPIAGVGAVDPQYALGVRYQIPLNKDWIFRADATYQIKEEQEDDDFGVRSEIRRKF